MLPKKQSLPNSTGLLAIFLFKNSILLTIAFIFYLKTI